jgi:hypothetical protein
MQYASFSQQQNSTPIFQSPNAAGLGTFGQYDISPFTGLANIDVNVFSFNEGDIPVECKLRYFSGGVKPSQHPGWVGQNWTLNVGGVVTRKVNGGVDEVATSSPVNGDENIYAYLYKYSYLNDANWYSNTYISSLYPNNAPANVLANLAPDEFMFSLPNGISGSFFLNHLGNWVVETNAGDDLKVTVKTNTDNPSYPNPIVLTNQSLVDGVTYSLNIKRVIYTIEITDSKGFKYTFGNSPNAIEFNRGARSTQWTNNEDVVANAWYLTKIESLKGNTVDFNYVRKPSSYQYVQNVNYPNSMLQGAEGGLSSYTSSPLSYSGHIISPVYLESITSQSFKVDFSISETAEMKYSYKPSSFGGLKFNYSDLEISDVQSPTSIFLNSISKWFKLNTIIVSDRNNIVREKYGFVYNDNPNERLFLKKFKKISPTLSENDIVYEFDYNNIAQLPSYNAMQNDRWGYFNGQQFPNDITGMSESDVLGKLAMDPIKAQYGTLTDITYPTGGKTSFIYQPNDFSSVLQKTGSPPSISLINQSGIGGGLRIWKIVNTDGYGGAYTMEYQYTKQATGSSSGILAGNKRVHISYSIGIPSMGMVDSYDINDYAELDYTHGRDVVYSEVKKINPDMSYTIYKYSNSENATYIDEPPLNIYTDGYLANCCPVLAPSSTMTSSNSNPFLSHNSRELERGQLLSETDYSSVNAMVRNVSYVYNSDVNRFNEFIRSYDSYSVGVSIGGQVARERYFQAVKIYTYYPYLQSKSEIFYDQQNGAPIQTSVSFTYGLPSHRQVKLVSSTNSKSELNLVETIYNKDIVDGTVTLPVLTANQLTNLTNMFSVKNVIAPIHINKKLNSALVGQERFNFNNNFWLESYQASNGANPLETKSIYSVYDTKGNIVQMQKSNDLTQCFLWGYNFAYPIAEIKNASFQDVLTVLGQPTIDGLNSNAGTDDQIRQTLNTLRTAPSLINAQIATYTYGPLVGMTSQTDAKNQTSYFEYDSFNRLKVSKDYQGNIIKIYDYNFKLR